MKRVAVMVVGSVIAAAVGVGAPAAAWPGDIGAGTEVRIAAEGFGAGATGIGDYETLSETAVDGVAASSYEYPPPTWGVPGGFWSCPAGTGCADWDASVHSSVDVAAGTMKAFAQTSIYTGGNVDNAGFSDVDGMAYIDDTITLSEPATVTLEGTVHVRHGSHHSHHGWYGDPKAKLEVDLAFRREGTGSGEWVPWENFGGFEETFHADLLNSCPYPTTCGADPTLTVGPTDETRPFSVEIALPAGTTNFGARMLADIDIQVWGTNGDEHRSVHGASALIDGSNTLDFAIRVPDGVTATSGSGLLPIVGGSTVTDTTPPAIACDEPPSGWQAANVTVSCTAADDGSGLADPADASFSLSTNVPEGVETDDAATGSHEVCDVAGNCATAGPIGGIEVDRRAPAVNYAGNAGAYDAGDVIEITCLAEDLGSGIASHSCEDAVGPAYTFASGENTLVASAVDLVGNEGTASTSFTVVVTTDGLGDLVSSFVDHAGIERSLLAKLDAAAAAANERARSGKLRAFVNHVSAQSGKALSHEHAEVLERLAGAL